MPFLKEEIDELYQLAKGVVGNALRYLLKIDLLIHERGIGRNMCNEHTIKLYSHEGLGCLLKCIKGF